MDCSAPAQYGLDTPPEPRTQTQKVLTLGTLTVVPQESCHFNRERRVVGTPLACKRVGMDVATHQVDGTHPACSLYWHDTCKPQRRLSGLARDLHDVCWTTTARAVPACNYAKCGMAQDLHVAGCANLSRHGSCNGQFGAQELCHCQSVSARSVPARVLHSRCDRDSDSDSVAAMIPGTWMV